MERNVVCKKDDIQPGQKKVVQIGRASVLVVRNKEDNYYAIRNTCPHQGAEFMTGPVRGVARSEEVHKICYEEQGDHIYCPWHQWSFDLKTGCAEHDPENFKVKKYDIKVEGNDLVVYV